MQKKDLEALRVLIREEIRRFIEPFLFVIVLLIALALIFYGKQFVDSYWQALSLNIGSNLLVFVLLFWAFQYLLGKQPGDHKAEYIDNSYRGIRGILDAEAKPINNEELGSVKPAKPRFNHKFDLNENNKE